MSAPTLAFWPTLSSDDAGNRPSLLSQEKTWWSYADCGMSARCSEWYISFPQAFDDAGEYMELSFVEIRNKGSSSLFLPINFHHALFPYRWHSPGWASRLVVITFIECLLCARHYSKWDTHTHTHMCLHNNSHESRYFVICILHMKRLLSLLMVIWLMRHTQMPPKTAHFAEKDL